jgi:hypothetical protein
MDFVLIVCLGACFYVVCALVIVWSRKTSDMPAAAPVGEPKLVRGKMESVS